MPVYSERELARLATTALMRARVTCERVDIDRACAWADALAVVTRAWLGLKVDESGYGVNVEAGSIDITSFIDEAGEGGGTS